MAIDRLLAEWLNICDGCERIGDQLTEVEKDPVARSYCAKQIVRAMKAGFNITALIVDQITYEDLEAFRGALERIRQTKQRLAKGGESTGERRSR